MKTTNDGGPVYPCTKRTVVGDQLTAEVLTGMSLRDWFAGMVMPSLISLFSTGKLELKSGGKINEQHISAQAYAFADAMLKEREK